MVELIIGLLVVVVDAFLRVALRKIAKVGLHHFARRLEYKRYTCNGHNFNSDHIELLEFLLFEGYSIGIM